MGDKTIKLNPNISVDPFRSLLDPQSGVSLATMKSVGSKYGLSTAAFRQYCALSSKAGMKCSADARYDWVRFAVGSGIASAAYWRELEQYAAGGKAAAKLTGAAKPGGVSRADAAKKVVDAGSIEIPTVCMYSTAAELRAAAKVLGVSLPKGAKKEEICAYLVAEVGAGKVQSTLRAQMVASGKVESLKKLAALKEVEGEVPASSLSLFKGLKDKADPAAAAEAKALALQSGADVSIDELKKMGGGGGGGGARKPRRKAKGGYKKRGGSRSGKYQDAQGRWRYGSGKKKGKYAPAPRS